MEGSSDQQQKKDKQKEVMPQQHLAEIRSQQQFPLFHYGKVSLPFFPPSHPSSFKPLNNFLISDEQQVLLTALWRASSPSAKLNALNALNFYFASLPAYYAIYNGNNPGIFTNSFDLMKERNSIWKRFTKFSDAFSSLSEHLKTTKFFVETEQTEKLIANKTSLSTAFSSPNPQQRSYEQALTEDLKKDQEIKRLLESVHYWQSLPDANRKQLSIYEEKMRTEREEFLEKENSFLAQISSLKLELQRANSMVISLSSELRAHEELEPDRELFDMSFEKMTRHLALLPQKKDFFLETLQDYVPDIVEDIVSRADRFCFQKILNLQQQLLSALSHPLSGIIVVQKSDRFLIPGEVPSRKCLLAIISWDEIFPEQHDFVSDLFFYGMIYKIIVEPDRDIPFFLGPTIVSSITAFKGNLPCTLCVSSEFPSSYNASFLPAHHQIFIYQCSHRVTYPYEIPREPHIIDDEDYYLSFTDYTEPSFNAWTILSKTETITVWCPSTTYGFSEKVRHLHSCSSFSSAEDPISYVDSDGNSIG